MYKRADYDTGLLVDLSVRSGMASQLIQASLSSPRLRLLAVAAGAAGALLRLPGFTRGGTGLRGRREKLRRETA